MDRVNNSPRHQEQSWRLTAAAGLLVLAWMFAGCERQSGYVVNEPITEDAAVKVYRRAFKPPVPFLSSEEAKKAYETQAEMVAGEAERHLKFVGLNHDITYDFYFPADFTLPTDAQLEKLLDFLKKYYGRQYQPARNVQMFIGNFGQQFSYTNSDLSGLSNSTISMVNVNPDIDRSIFAMGPTGNFATEFCQSALVGNMSLAEKWFTRLDRESACNQLGIATEALRTDSLEAGGEICAEFGIACEAVGRGLSYEEYKKHGSTTIYLGDDQLTLIPYTEEQYKELKAIFHDN